jgi:hypothetical protein
MRKLKLNLDALNVTSFETGEQQGQGTVMGHVTLPPSEISCPGMNTCDPPTYDGAYTCAYTCNNCTIARNCYSQHTECGGCLPPEEV